MAELRIGDAERESAVTALGEHYAHGRLTKDEYDERSDAAWTARTAADLRPLFADLPASSAPRSAPPVPATFRPRPRSRVPWVPLVVALAALSLVTHLPFVLVAVVLWFVLSRHRVVPSPPWAGHHPPPPWGRRDHDAGTWGGGHGR